MSATVDDAVPGPRAILIALFIGLSYSMVHRGRSPRRATVRLAVPRLRGNGTRTERDGTQTERRATPPEEGE